MTKITITFIFAFPIGGEELTKKVKKGKEKKNKKSKKTKVIEKEITKINCIIVGNINNYMHIQYNLIPNRSPCLIDLISWGPVAKVNLNSKYL